VILVNFNNQSPTVILLFDETRDETDLGTFGKPKFYYDPQILILRNMRFNDKDVMRISQRSGQIEGKLQHREPSGSFRDNGFRERFCKVVGNLLFFFRITEFGTIDTKEPAGLIVLENYLVSTETDPSLPFAFGLVFRDDGGKKHVFTARTDQDAERWVRILREASCQYWKDRYQVLMRKINSLTAQGRSEQRPRPVQKLENRIQSLGIKSAPRSQTPTQDGSEIDLIVF